MEKERHSFLSCDEMVVMEWKVVDQSIQILFLYSLEFYTILAVQHIDVKWPVEQFLSSYRLLCK